MLKHKKPVEVVVEKSFHAEAPVIENGYIVANGGVYVAKKKCYFGIKLYPKGAEYQSTRGEKIPCHFNKKKKFVEVED